MFLHMAFVFFLSSLVKPVCAQVVQLYRKGSCKPCAVQGIVIECISSYYRKARKRKLLGICRGESTKM